MPTGQRRFKKQAFGAAKDAKTKALIKRNATTSPLLKLPLELRQRIWGYVLGHQLVHLTEEPFNLKYGNVVSPDRRWRWFHTVCQSTTTEREAYELSRSEEYDKSASEMNEGEDMRFCRNRHVACFKALKDADRHNRPPNKLHIELLSVCRQAYIEANPILWSTTIWSPWGYCNWRRWCDIRTPLQRQLIKKVHLDTNVVHDYVHKTNISLFANWKELYVDVTVNRSTYKHMKQYFSADEIFVICSGTEEYTGWRAEELHSDNGATTWEERAALAEALRSHLAVLGQEARDRKEKSEAKANARKSKNTLRNAEVSSDSAKIEQLDARGE